VENFAALSRGIWQTARGIWKNLPQKTVVSSDMCGKHSEHVHLSVVWSGMLLSPTANIIALLLWPMTRCSKLVLYAVYTPMVF